MSKTEPIIAKHEPRPGSLRTYVVGFVSSIVLTLAAFTLVESHDRFARDTIITVIISLALTQCLVQLFCFLHLGRELRPRWKLWVFYFMIGVVLILVLGSLWIMSSLNYHMMPDQVNDYLTSQDSL
ncbi:MAG TPA: cytochrome o ubiquinol oxidase subunit IV [Candidatus Saccharimonadales bacterium]|nr:cytochrome o ubiquinol oxidase subunit IV [Candidatus Saccharimonadales bacterium]